MFKDLTETLISILLAVALIAVSYHALSSWLVASVATSFDGLR